MLPMAQNEILPRGAEILDAVLASGIPFTGYKPIIEQNLPSYWIQM